MRRGYRQLTTGWLLAATIVVAPAVARAQTTASVSATFTVPEQVKLTITSGGLLTFPNSDPDTVPTIVANEGAVTITAKAANTGTKQLILLVRASQNLTSNVPDFNRTIGISAVKWTGGGTGFVSNGTMTLVDQQAAVWTGSGTYTGTMTFSLANSWSYSIGNYGTTLSFTLTNP